MTVAGLAKLSNTLVARLVASISRSLSHMVSGSITARPLPIAVGRIKYSCIGIPHRHTASIPQSA